ncbi:MAG: 30S ribosomal protein S6 [Phycisphaerales bacterium]|nr:30S ribosomal protein S6 [Phycisphaerales bacterium]
MPAHIRQYEALFLLNASYATGSWETAKGEVEHILHRANAEILHVRKWDERKLSFEIEGQKRGVYILAFFKCEGPKVAGIERDVQLSENILRCLVLQAEHLALKDIEAMQPQQPIADEHDTRAFRRAGALGAGAPARERAEAEVEEEVPEDLDKA